MPKTLKELIKEKYELKGLPDTENEAVSNFYGEPAIEAFKEWLTQKRQAYPKPLLAQPEINLLDELLGELEK
jgi:hypothetical protein